MDEADNTGRARRLSKEGLWVVSGQFVSIVGAMVGLRILTELLDPAVFGELALAMTLVTLVHQTILGSLSNGITRYWTIAIERNQFGRYISVVRRLAFRATALLTILMVLFSSATIAIGKKELLALILASIIFAIFRGHNTIIGGMQNAARKRKVVALHQAFESWSRFLLAVLFVVLLGATSESAMAGYMVAMFFVLVSQYWFFSRCTTTSSAISDESTDWSDSILSFSWPFALFGVFTWAQFSTGRWALEMYSGTEDVGYFAVLYQLGFYPMSLLTGVAIQFLAPVFYQRAGDAQDAARNRQVQVMGSRLTAFILFLTIAGTLFTYFLHGFIFKLLVAVEYHPVSYLLPWILMSGGLVAAGQTVELGLMSQLRIHKMIVAKLVTAIIGVGLNFTLARNYGLAGVTVAGILYSIPYLIWMMILANQSNRDNEVHA